MNQLVEPLAMGNIKLNLCGPWNCRSDVNKRATKKVWGVVIIDKNSRAVHCHVVMDYSPEEVIKMLCQFGSVRGWPMPSEISSDLCSQLECASGGTGAWWRDITKQLLQYAETSKF